MSSVVYWILFSISLSIFLNFLFVRPNSHQPPEKQYNSNNDTSNWSWFPLCYAFSGLTWQVRKAFILNKCLHFVSDSLCVVPHFPLRWNRIQIVPNRSNYADHYYAAYILCVCNIGCFTSLYVCFVVCNFQNLLSGVCRLLYEHSRPQIVKK